ncbi:MAG TPA: ABC transporter ATP-binding protein [Methylomirabilota bacterium]|nr:ABC transporter ATP-binding protein [Methylomirabilota bacterium]
MTDAEILAADRLVAGYEPDVPIIRGVSIVVHRGEIVVILGPNGAGKSTLIKAIAGLVPVTAGRIRLAGQDITSVPAHRIVHQGLAFVPQTDNVFTAMTVDENLELSGHILPQARRRRQIEAMCDLFPDLAAQRRSAAGRLSGGQRQMLAIARGLMIEPVVLMLDEPSAGLSPKLVQSCFAKLAEIRQSGVTILLVEQNARAALAIGDRAYVLADGQNRHEAAAEALASDPTVARLYLGGMAAAPQGEANP